ncbi:MAG: type I 3-dehydroquinate dehydratase, partial [Bacteroidales bacterium]
MAEIRADLCKFSTKEIEQIITGHPNILITCRIANSSKEYASEQITHSIIRGAKYVDIELEAPDTYLKYIKSYAKANNCKLIISYHNFKETNSIEELIKIYDLCLRKGADIVKIVTTAHNISDAVRTLSLYKTDKYLTHNNGSLVAFAMGEAGKFTRYLCLALGAPYTYIAYNKESATAPGQYTKAEIEQLLEP